MLAWVRLLLHQIFGGWKNVPYGTLIVSEWLLQILAYIWLLLFLILMCEIIILRNIYFPLWKFTISDSTWLCLQCFLVFTNTLSNLQHRCTGSRFATLSCSVYHLKIASGRLCCWIPVYKEMKFCVWVTGKSMTYFII